MRLHFIQKKGFKNFLWYTHFEPDLSAVGIRDRRIVPVFQSPRQSKCTWINIHLS